MKKKIITVLLTALVLVLIAALVWAAGSCTVTTTSLGEGKSLITYSWTGDAAGGNVPATASASVEGYIKHVETIPGTPAPTALYDITLTNSDGIDMMNGATMNRSASAGERAWPLGGATNVPVSPYLHGPLQMNLSNSAANSAVGTVKVYIDRNH